MSANAQRTTTGTDTPTEPDLVTPEETNPRVTK
jgi:hypothetical protein